MFYIPKGLQINQIYHLITDLQQNYSRLHVKRIINAFPNDLYQSAAYYVGRFFFNEQNKFVCEKLVKDNSENNYFEFFPPLTI